MLEGKPYWTDAAICYLCSRNRIHSLAAEKAIDKGLFDENRQWIGGWSVEKQMRYREIAIWAEEFLKKKCLTFTDCNYGDHEWICVDCIREILKELD